jgi:hypothetical protein
MGKKTRHTKKRSTRRKTLRRRKTCKGGAALIPNTDHSQDIVIPSKSFGAFATPENSADPYSSKSK